MTCSWPLPLAAHADLDVVLFEREGSLSAAALRRRVRGLQSSLARLPGERVVLACAERTGFCTGLLAAWSMGLEVWLPHNVQTDSVERLAHSPGVRALLHDCDGGRGIDVREVAPAQDDAPLVWEMPADRIAAVVHTSGSTGEPVAHAKTWGQFASETAVLLSQFGLAERCVVATVPPHHIYGLLFGVLVPLCGGGRVGSASPLLPRDVSRALLESGADVLVSVPAQLRSLASEDVPARCTVFSSGAPLPSEAGGRLRAGGCRLVEVLGSTETGGMAWRDSAAEVWRALPDVRCGALEDGRLTVDSPWLSPSAARPFVCADRVELVEQGFRHVGRADRVVKLGGRRVDLGAVENALDALEGVRASRVVAVATPGLRGMQLLAAVEGEGLSPASLRAALCLKLDPVTVPRRYRIVEHLPRSAAGKLTDAVVRALFQDSAALLDEAALEVSLPCGASADLAQLTGLAEAQARECWPELGPLARAECSPLPSALTGADLVLSLTRPTACEVLFDLCFEGQPAGSGQLLFQEVSR